jgi:transposase
MRKTYSKDFKFKVAIEAIRGDMTIAQMVSRFQVAESLIHKWRKQLLDQGYDVFDGKGSPKDTITSVDVEKLHTKIGQLTLERDFLERALSKVR